MMPSVCTGDPAPEGFSWQLAGDGYPYLMNRAKNAARAKAWRAAQKVKLGPAYRQAENERNRRWYAAQKAKLGPAWREAENERHRRYYAARKAATAEGRAP